MSNYVYAKHFRELKEFTVQAIYPFYRNGGVRIDDKYIPRTFIYEDGKILEKVWEDKKPKLVEPDIAIDREFFKTYKKVFDVRLTTPEEVTLDGKTGTDFTIRALGAGKIQKMLKADFDLEIPMNGDKEAFDWEDKVYKQLVGRTFKMKVIKTGDQPIDVEYQFKLVDSKPVATEKDILDEPW